MIALEQSLNEGSAPTKNRSWTSSTIKPIKGYNFGHGASGGSLNDLCSYVLLYIISVSKNSGEEKSYPKSDQTFQADFNKLLFILIAWKLIQFLMDFHRS